MKALVVIRQVNQHNIIKAAMRTLEKRQDRLPVRPTASAIARHAGVERLGMIFHIA